MHPLASTRSRMTRGPLAPAFAATILGLAIVARHTAAWTVAPPAAGDPVTLHAMEPEAIRGLAREAYVWGWPLAYVHHCRSRVALVPRAGKSGGLPVAPLNELAMLTDQVAPRTALVPCPNRDVLYGFGIFDLADTPVILQVPDFGDRFWLYQLGDQRTDGFAEIGSMYGTRPGCYLVVGPGWAGGAPPGIVGVLRSPTRHAYCIPRVFFSTAPGDRDAAVAAVEGVMAYPLDEFTGVPRSRDWTRLRWLPSLSCDGCVVSPGGFLGLLPRLLDDVPPLPGEGPLYARFRRLVAAVRADPALAAAAQAAIAEAEQDVVAPLFEFRNVGNRLPAGWNTLTNGAAFGTDYLTRTAVARSNVFVNRHRETKYYYLDVDAEGRRLHGDRRHVLTFPAGQLPPAAGFWSLTAYDSRHALPSASTARHSIGSRDTDLALAPDGSLTIVIEPAGAGGDGQNAIVAPEGPFSLYLRLYAPDERAMNGLWTPPPASSEPAHAGGPLPGRRAAAGSQGGDDPSADFIRWIPKT
jgi:hypothetical protein